MDPVALALANALVGNRDGEAALEATLIGPEIVFEEDVLVALCGAQFDARVEGTALPLDRPIFLKAGRALALRRAIRGVRAYLAVAGGIAVPPVLGSRSTYLPARFGGLEGRALRKDDVLPLDPNVAGLSSMRYEKLSGRGVVRAGLGTVRWSAPALTLPDREPILVHVIEGRHYTEFDADSKRRFLDAVWQISPDSNRMGYRLAGAALARPQGGEILSEPTCLGTVQVPANGAPIVLMADHQTTGGYPKIAEVAGADVPRLAQLGPGGTLRFARCSLETALELRRALNARLASALRAIAWEHGQ